MDGTIVCSGSFVSNGESQTIIVPSDYDYIHIQNFTGSDSSIDFRLFDFYWQTGMPSILILSNTFGTVNSGRVFLQAIQKYNLDTQTASSLPYPITNITNTAVPTITFSTPAGQLPLFAGNVMQIYGTEQLSTNGVEWRISSTGSSSVRMVPIATPLANAPGSVATKGFMRRLNYGAFFRPTTAVIIDIDTINPVAITTNISHGLAPGCIVRFNIPPQCGTVELNSTPLTNYKYYTVQLILTTQSFTIDADGSGFTPFSWVTTQNIAQGSQFPTYTVVGENTADALSINSFPETNDILSDAVQNVQFIGAILGPTAVGPAGVMDDVIYWEAGKVMYGGL